MEVCLESKFELSALSPEPRVFRMVSQSFIILCFVILSFANCAKMGPKKAAYPGLVTPEIQSKFNEVEEQYRRKRYDYAFSGYQHFIESYTYNALTDEALYKQGKIFFLTKRYSDAVNKFKELAGKTPSALYRAKAMHMAAYSNFKMERYDLALQELDKIHPEVLPAKLRVQYFSLIIESSKLSGSEQDYANFAKVNLLNLYEEYAGPGLKNLRGANIVSYPDVHTLVDVWIDEPMSSAAIPTWMKRFPDSPAKSYVEFKLAKIYYDEDNKKKARSLFSRFVHKYPKSPYTPKAEKILLSLGGAELVTDVALTKAKYKIGVLLPMTGRYESYSRSVLDGIRCAVGVGNICGGESGIQLIIQDTGFTPGSVREAVDKLANQNVVAIIGPLSGKMAIEAGLIATTKKIPIFPITQKSQLMKQGDYIFQVGLPARQQIKSLVKAAFDRGHKTFGVFYPENNYGRTMAELFVDEVKSYGGRIVANASYKKRSPDPFAEARKLKRSIGRVGAPGKGVGFDALFIPDSYTTINTLVSALEFNGIKGIPLLGTNAWNDPGLTLAIANKFPGSFFVDLYDGASKNKAVKDFKAGFIQGYGRTPRVLEAYGYDIVMMIRTSAASRGARKIKETLEIKKGFDGVTGIKGFDVGVGPVIESMVLKIRESGVKE